MNIYLLQLVGKWISVAVVMFASMGGTPVNTQSFNINNASKNMNVSVVSKIVNYKTIIKYNDKLPYDTKKVVTEGITGIVYTDIDGVTEKVLRQPVNEVVEIGRGIQGEYTGVLTGYGPDCPGCSKTGTVSCRTETKTNHSLVYDGINYTDSEYGKIRILAAATKVFPCGTIVLVDNGVLEPFYGVVLDTGYTMRKAWEKDQTVHMDLAFESQSSVKNATSHNTKFSVQRWGW